MRELFHATVIFKPPQPSNFTSMRCFVWRICRFFRRCIGYDSGYVFLKHTHWSKTTHSFPKKRRMRYLFDATVISKPTQTSNFTLMRCFFCRICMFTSRILGDVGVYGCLKKTYASKSTQWCRKKRRIRELFHAAVISKSTTTSNCTTMRCFVWQVCRFFRR
jgi:hypothetical protein